MTRTIRTLTTLVLTFAVAPVAVAGPPGGLKPGPWPKPFVTPIPVPKPILYPKPIVYPKPVVTAKPVAFAQINTATPYVQSYHLHHGVKFTHGYLYKGLHHNHWTRIYVHPVHHCRVYYCPFTRLDYYWCAPDGCFYPISYCPYGHYNFP